jgi:hypothetical protein
VAWARAARGGRDRRQRTCGAAAWGAGAVGDAGEGRLGVVRQRARGAADRARTAAQEREGRLGATPEESAAQPSSAGRGSGAAAAAGAEKKP